MAKITLKKIRLYEVFGIGVVGVKGEDTVMLNYENYNINDLGVGPINWLKKYAQNRNNIHSDSIYRILKKNKKLDFKGN